MDVLIVQVSRSNERSTSTALDKQPHTEGGWTTYQHTATPMQSIHG